MSTSSSTTQDPVVVDVVERAIAELSALRDVNPPVGLVARVMTKLEEPRTPSLWQWLGRPFSIEIRLSPLTLLALTLAMGAAFVFIGATMK